MNRLRVLMLSALALAACATTAVAAPTIEPVGDADGVWNARQTPEYRVTGSEPGAEVTWEVINDPGREEFEGRSPFIARVPELPDGDYLFEARERGRSDGRECLRARECARVPLVIDRTAPAEPAIVSPPAGMTYQQGDVVLAAYSCEPGVRCEGSAPVGGPVDTATPGTFSFSVVATDRAGNETVATRAYTVAAQSTAAGAPSGQASPDAPPSAAGPAAPAAPAPTPVAAPRPSPAASPARLKPVLLNARRLTPRAGARFAALRPTLRWKPRRGTVLYNVQVFRLDGTRLRKVLSVFPRATRYQVPRGRLAPGRRYVWRVWPFLGRAKGFTPKPLGVSYFDLRPRRR